MSTQLTTTDTELSKWDDKFDHIVRWYNDPRPEDDPKRIRLSAPLQQQYKRWCWLYAQMIIPKNRYKRDSDLIDIIVNQYPDLTERTARTILRDTRRFFSVLDEPNLAWEKVMLIGSMKDTLRKAKQRNDIKGANAAEKNLMTALGADKPEEHVENKTIINLINFNPEQLGAIGMPPEQLDEMIHKLLTEDKRKAERPFDEYEEVAE